ncbi:hypothetical protein M8542_28850 [Amycolatopsis sp. OK19-0408]|uniref:Uncharacterized protein n=1 Tax=Amycolatopsis iheyensis TaxID=2945988 RepID=A0A9X2NHK5_9PSEU|nr:hypothetical protein [Amycolatopsis iheyensis]MCR6486845.1 hypothetical protein [Amycolatopsis iheyensis]
MGQQGRRRDFGEFGAKLEKHIEKLPDYAVRAQEKLQKVQKYFPPAEQAGGKTAPPPRSRPNPLQRPPVRRPDMTATWSSMANQVPAFAEARAKWDRWNHPAAKLERRKRRASRAMTLWILLTVLCGVLAVAAGLGWMSATGAAMMPQAIMAFAGAVVFGTFGVRSGLKLRELKRTPIPAAPAAPAGPPPLPPAGSAAREPMERLTECEASLSELLRQLSVPSSVGTTPVSEVSVADARQTATEAAAALRGLAGRIQAIERGRNSAPAREQAALDAAVGKLREQLEDGLEGFRGLVAAAGHTVAASSDGLVTSKQALTDATDRLAGLAMALRELS